MTYVVSIGRNIGSEPMSATEWSNFQRSLVATLEAYGLAVVFKGEGEGIYEDEREDSFTLIAVGELSLRSSPLSFNASLATLAREYRQEAIAVVKGETTFVG